MWIKSALLIFLLFLINPLHARNTDKIKRVIELRNGIDTVKIEEYDRNGNLCFLKYYPFERNASQIISFTYKNNKLVSSARFHSDFGIVYHEFAYDSVQQKRYMYEYKDELPKSAELIKKSYSFNDLLQVKEYKKAMNKRNKTLKSIAIMNDSLVNEEIVLTHNGDTSAIIKFSYVNGKLKSKSIASGKKVNVILYAYDEAGRDKNKYKENKQDTVVTCKYIYKNNLLFEEQEFEQGKLKAVTKYEYDDRLVIKEIESDARGNVTRIVNMYYNNQGLLIKKTDNSSRSYLRNFEIKYEVYN